MPRADWAYVSSSVFDLPPLAEQRKIAEILSTWDEAIAKTEALIAALEQRKKGLMQRLLTGQVRFPGFTDPWREVRLQKIAKITMGQSPSSSAYNNQGIGLPLIQGNADILNRKTNPKIHTSEITKECFENDIIVSVRAPVGEIALATVHGCIGRGVCAIQATNCDNSFLYQLLIYNEKLWLKYAQGSTFTAINSTDIRNMSFKIPKTSHEQEAIARILNYCDNEIILVKERLNKLKKQKKGLMQRLLTGEVRVQG
jgi:type I restriction enzyme S subunit